MAERETKTYRVEPRFGMGTILLSTLYCALVLTGCRLIGLAFPYDFLYLAGLVTLVAGSQAWFRSCGPRRVSCVAGAVYSAGWTLAFALVLFSGNVMVSRPTQVIDFLVAVAIGIVIAATGGTALGFCAGAIAASLFLFEDHFRRTTGRR